MAVLSILGLASISSAQHERASNPFKGSGSGSSQSQLQGQMDRLNDSLASPSSPMTSGYAHRRSHNCSEPFRRRGAFWVGAVLVSVDTNYALHGADLTFGPDGLGYGSLGVVFPDDCSAHGYVLRVDTSIRGAIDRCRSKAPYLGLGNPRALPN